MMHQIAEIREKEDRVLIGMVLGKDGRRNEKQMNRLLISSETLTNAQAIDN